MSYWGRTPDYKAIYTLDDVKGLPLLEDCRTTACIGGWTCHLATEDEITGAVSSYNLSDDDLNEPAILSAALLVRGAGDVTELKKASSSLFYVKNWPHKERGTYCESQTAVERKQVVLRRMESWAKEIEARQSGE